jgi:hypothetical protein
VRSRGAVELGRRVFIRTPTAGDRDEFLALVSASCAFLGPWVEPPGNPAAFAAYLRRTRRPTERSFLVRRRRDHERWALTADRRPS